MFSFVHLKILLRERDCRLHQKAEDIHGPKELRTSVPVMAPMT